MSISPVKRLILETMWLLDKPAKATEIAKAAGLAFPSTMMHVLGLTKMKYAETVEKGTYNITETGKEALSLPRVNKEKAAEILAYVPVDKSFHFYADIGKPLNIYASGLGDFCEKILKVDQSSLEFHIRRGDFETWFSSLGDIELAGKTLLIREQKSSGDELRNRFYGTVKNRCNELARIRNTQPAAPA